MNIQRQKAIWLGMLGSILIVLGVKYMPVFWPATDQQEPVSIPAGPVLFFFNEDDPCDCMVELTQGAEQQMANWPVERQGGIQVVRIAMEQRKDLEAKYKVFRSPCLVLVDAQGQVAWRQDYPLIEDGPFALDELEAAILEMGTK